MDYKSLVVAYTLLEKTSKRLEKTHIISELLKRTPKDELAITVLLLEGSVFPPNAEEKLGVSDKLVIKALSVAFGHTSSAIEGFWRDLGDLGDVAAKLAQQKKQRTLVASHLTVKKVFNNLRKLPELQGSGSTDQKIQLIAELLADASPLEAKYATRTVLQQLRVGIAGGTLRDAIVWAFLNPPGTYDEKENNFIISDEDRKTYNDIVDATQKAYDLLTDFGKVAELAKEKGLKGLGKIELEIGFPLKLMLCQKSEGVEDALNIVGSPAAFEFKYDGFRIQVHKKGNEITLFTRRLENVTKQFPDIVNAVKEHTQGKDFILDGEAVGFDAKSKKYLPFQTISQRIKRKHGIEEMAKQFPVELCIFDVLYYNGEPCLLKPQSERRKIIEKIIEKKPFVITPSKYIVTDSVAKAKAFFAESLQSGEEGLIAKRLDSVYQPGSRVGSWVKIKGVLDTLDLVIVAAEWGEGKRSGWFTSFTLACLDDGHYKECGKVGTGIKEKEEAGGITFEELTNRLKPLIKEEKGREVKVKPKIVVEIECEEIQKSPTYEAGYALRFPRVIQIREDKPASEATTLEMLEEQFRKQKKGQ